MRPMLRFLPLVVLTPLVILGCDDRPSTYEECILDLGRSRTARETVELCETVFPAGTEDVPFFAGEFFYRTIQDECDPIRFRSSGDLSRSHRGFCGTGSTIMCRSGECRLTCLRYGGSDSTVLRRVVGFPFGLALVREDESRSPKVLYRQEAACLEGRTLESLVEKR